MRKNKYHLLSLIIFFIIGSCYFSIMSHAQANQPIFIGEIKQKYNFTVGDIPSSDDFIIEGYLEYEGKTYSDLEVVWIEGAINDINKTDYSVGVTESNNIVTTNVNINLNVSEFTSKISYMNEGKEITIDKIKWKSKDGFETIFFYEDLMHGVINENGKPVNGEMKFSNNIYNIKVGYNEIEYRFTPFDERYDTLYGKFTVIYNGKPRIYAHTNYIKVNLPKSDYLLFVNGKAKKNLVASKLKDNTTYRVEIKQKIIINDESKDVTVWSGNVKTRKSR